MPNRRPSVYEHPSHTPDLACPCSWHARAMHIWPCCYILKTWSQLNYELFTEGNLNLRLSIQITSVWWILIFVMSNSCVLKLIANILFKDWTQNQCVWKLFWNKFQLCWFWKRNMFNVILILTWHARPKWLHQIYSLGTPRNNGHKSRKSVMVGAFLMNLEKQTLNSS